MDNLSIAKCIALGAVLPAVDCIVVGLRLYARWSRRDAAHGASAFKLDDAFIVFALALTLAIGIVFIVGTQIAGFGHFLPSDNATAAYDLKSKEFITTKRLTELTNFLAPWMWGAPKLSVLFFYKRIFRGSFFTGSFYMLCAVTIAWIITTWLLILLQCGSNIELLWASSSTERGTCLLGSVVAIPMAAIDVLIDLCILILPLFLIWQLNLILWKKLATSIIFVFGGLAIAASIVRLAKYSRLYPGQEHKEFRDLYQFNTSIVYWSLLEGGLAIIPACLPTLGPLVSDEFGSALAKNLQNGWYHLTTRGSSQSGASRPRASTTRRRGSAFHTDRGPGKDDARLSSNEDVYDGRDVEEVEMRTLSVAEGKAAERGDATPGAFLEIGVSQHVMCKAERR